MNSFTIKSGKTRKHTDALTVKTIDFNTEKERLSEVSLTDLRNLNVDAIVIRNFLNKVDISILLKNLFALPENKEALSESKTFPMSFALLNRNSPNFAEELKDYYRRSKAFKNSFPQGFGVDMQRKFTDVLKQLNGNNAAKVLETRDNGSYIPFTFRMIVPEKNHINLHADNMFSQFAPEFYELLRQEAEVENQLSFFTVLQKADAGGQLSLYNVAWDVAKEFSIEKQSIILETGRHLHANNEEELYREQIELEEGDLVVFPGGQLYHRVEEVYGNKLRITLGGFVGYSKTDESVYYWS